MAQLGMRHQTETFIDALTATTSALATTSSEGLRGQSTDAAPAMHAPLAAADAPPPTAPADSNSIVGAHLECVLNNDYDDFFQAQFAAPIPWLHSFTVYGLGGNDNITGYVNDDELYGGDGNDALSGGG